ncbi:MAG: hypothetical protein PVG84_01525 [Desulfobacterales bacterium]
MININDITRQVLHNCDTSDAYHAGMFSICGLALRLRDLYKWEKDLPVWEEGDSAKVLEWIEAKENKWEDYPEDGFKELSINGEQFDPFDTIGINSILEPHQVFYGAGYARSLKPTFFLTEITEKTNYNGNIVYALGRELARDLLTIPALTQDDCVLLRQESATLFLWDSILYIKKSARPALKFALDSCGLINQEPKALQPHLTEILAVLKDNYIYHEIGELHDTDFDRKIWREIIAAFPYSPVEYLARAVKDLLADTNKFGTLQHIIRERKTASLAFYAAFLDGLAKEFFPELLTSFQEFTQTGDWEAIDQAVASGHKTAKQHAAVITDLYKEGVRKNDNKWAESEIQKQLLGK